MKTTIRTKAVAYTIFIVVVTSVISAVGASLLNIAQTRRDNQKRLHTALISFERNFSEISETVENQFRTFQNEKDLAIQTIQTVKMGWSLEIGLSFTGAFGKYEELLIKSGMLDGFGFYYAPNFKGKETLALYYEKSSGNFAQVENGLHYKRLSFGRKEIKDMALFSIEMQLLNTELHHIIENSL